MIFTASFEDFLYILAGLAWLIFSIYSSNKKKKAKQAKKTESEKETTPNFLDSIMNEFGIEKDTPQQEPHQSVYEPYTFEEDDLAVEKESLMTESKESNFQDSEPTSYDDYYEESNFSEISDVIEQGNLVGNDIKTKLQTKKPTIKKGRKVNLKKAIIYSEILNNRYF